MTARLEGCFTQFSIQPYPTYSTHHVMEVSGDDIAEVVLKQFDALPAKRKPLVRGDGMQEWVPLSGIVAQGGSLNP